MTAAPHPAKSALLRLAQGQLSTSAAEPLRAHLATCAACRAELLQLGEATDDAGRPLEAPQQGPGTEPRPGDRLGDYVVGEVLGEGGMGRVYRARHATSGQAVAIKLVLEDFAQNPEALRRALNEARAVNAVNHPNIVRILDVGALGDGRPWLVTELLPGKSLAELLHARGRLSVPETLEVLAKALDGVEAAHTVGVIHRDLKPENIFVDTAVSPWRVTVLDFGLALNLSSPSTRLTQSGIAMGTPAYMAPEQFLGDPGAATTRLDVYAMGMVAWAMLTGKPPFGEGSAAQVMYRHVHTPVPSLRAAAPEVPEALEALVAWMVEKAPGDRPTAAKVRAQIEALRTGAPTDVPRRRRRFPAALAAAAVAFVVGAAAVFELRSAPEAPPAPGPLPVAVGSVKPAPPDGQPHPVKQVNERRPEPPALEDAGEARAEVAPPQPEPFPGTSWRCRDLVSVSPIYREAIGPAHMFQLQFDGEQPLLVSAQRSRVAALGRLRKEILACKGRWQLVRARRTESYNLWATADGPILSGGVRAPHEVVEVVDEAPSATARSFPCEKLVEVGEVEAPAAGPHWSVAVKFSSEPTLLVSEVPLPRSRGAPALTALRAELLACKGKAKRVLAERASDFTDWKTGSGTVHPGGVRANVVDVAVRAAP